MCISGGGDRWRVEILRGTSTGDAKARRKVDIGSHPTGLQGRRHGTVARREHDSWGIQRINMIILNSCLSHFDCVTIPLFCGKRLPLKIWHGASQSNSITNPRGAILSALNVIFYRSSRFLFSTEVLYFIRYIPQEWSFLLDTNLYSPSSEL